MNRIFLLFVALLFFACSPQKRLQKTYVGQAISAMELEYGKAKTTFEKENSKVYIFEKVKHLRSTEISQHKLTLDPMVSPPVEKTERCFVTVVEGKISKIEVEEEYER